MRLCFKFNRKLRLPAYLKRLISKKKLYYKIAKQDPKAKSTYKYYEKLYKQQVKQHFKNLEHKIIASNNINNLYGYINKKLHSKHTIPPLKAEDGTMVLETNQKADLFNNFFSTVFIKDNGKVPKLFQSNFLNKVNSMQPILITQLDVKNSITKLKNSSSRTPENIPALFFKQTAAVLAYPLTKLFNVSLSCGKVPVLWKEAIIVPIHKKGDKSTPSNCRLLSMTSVICRILERIIHNKITNHLIKNNLLCDAQHGFIPHRSTLSQHLEMFNILTENFDKKNFTEMVYLDFSKAFDQVSHPKLLFILKSFKLDTNLVQWIKGFLSGRRQRTIINTEMSDFKNISSGVPQGSVLGPLLFLLYIDDLLKSLANSCPATKVYAFADDVKLLSSDADSLQRALNTVEVWSHDWQFLIQSTKSEHISYCRGKHPNFHNYSINGNLINQVATVKDLGLYTNNDLQWNTYLQHIKYKSDKLAYILLRFLKTRNLHTYTMAFTTYIRPICEYNTTIWSPYKITEIKYIETIQKTFTKKVCQKLNLKFNNYSDRLSIMGLESLEYRRLRFDLVTVYKILNKIIHINQENFFIISEIRNKYNLRRHKLHLNKGSLSKTNIRLNFFCNRIVDVWNQLPESVVTSKTLDMFKFKKIDLRSLHDFVF